MQSLERPFHGRKTAGTRSVRVAMIGVCAYEPNIQRHGPTGAAMIGAEPVNTPVVTLPAPLSKFLSV